MIPLKTASVGVLSALLGSTATYWLLDSYRVANTSAMQPVVVKEYLPAPPSSVPSATPAELLQLAELTRKNAELMAQLADERARVANANLTLTKTREDLDELRRPMMSDLISSTLRAELKSGETVVTGGYQLPGGSRLYAFASPHVFTDEGVEMVKIGGKFLVLSEEASTAAGLRNLDTNAANTLQHGEVWAAGEEAAVLKQLETMDGVDVLNTPPISLRSGTSSVIEMGDMKLKLTPILSSGRENLDFELRLEQPQPKLPDKETPVP